MSGICGLYDLDRKGRRGELQRIVQAMTDSLIHRGLDAQGYWHDPDVPLFLGNRRLATVDLSRAGVMPMVSPSGRYQITLDGAIYNFSALRSELESEGARFRTRTDTEVLLAACDIWGVNRTLQRLNGIFAFALWDREKRQLHLVRDRLGKKPLYVGWAGKSFVFGSELKALRAHPGFRPEINRTALTIYMRLGAITAPYTIYQGVWQLPPGHRMTLVFDLLSVGDDLSREWAPYWNIARIVDEACHNPLAGDDSLLCDQFEMLLRDCVRDASQADVPVGAFLTGGVDSSLVAALMQGQTTRRVRTYSVGFSARGYDEAAAAQAIARHLGTEHTEHVVTVSDAQEVLPRIATIYDEPIADIAQIPAIMLAELAHRDCAVSLSGVGGNEIVGGLPRHVSIPALWNRAGWWPQRLRQMASRGIRAVPIATWDRITRYRPGLSSWLYDVADILPLRDIDAAYLHAVTRWERASTMVRDGREPLLNLHDSTWQARELTNAERVVYNEALLLVGNALLPRIDRAGMAAGLETREPLLDHRVFEFCWRLPFDMRIRRTGRHVQGKWLLRQVLARHVPAHLFDGAKPPFAAPLGDWLRGPLRDWAHDLLNPARLEQQGYLNPAPVTAAWQSHLGGGEAQTERLWTVLMFQSWADQVLSDPPRIKKPAGGGL